MNHLFPISSNPRTALQNRLMQLAAGFLLLYSLILTLSPAVRYHTWAAPYRWIHWIGFFVWLIGFSWIARYIEKRLPERDPLLLPVAALLSGWGLLTIWRLSDHFGLRQTLWLAVSLAALYGALHVHAPLVQLRRFKYLWLTGGLLLTILTFFFGTYPGGVGPRLWLGCCGIYFQPSEPLKLLLIIYLAAYLADRLPLQGNLMQLITPTLVLVGVALVILVIQRDLGTASIFLLLYFGILYLVTGNRRIPIIASITLLAAGILGFGLFDVIRVRVEAWLNPWLDPVGNSYQIIQSIIAVASGKVFGRGPGLGNPGVVPIAHSDFIFSSIAEETGLLGTGAMIILFAMLAGRGMVIAMRAPSIYQRYLSAGVTLAVILQAILIIGGNIRLLPLTGVTLPFVSYGGSSLLTSFLCLFILLLISSQAEDEPVFLARPGPYRFVSIATLGVLFLTVVVSGWWAVFRADDLVERVDNPRRTVNEHFVKRGSILDRRNQPISVSTGESGTFTRNYLYPQLSLVTGYTHPLYGQAGMEVSLDPYLRGLQGNPASLIWSRELLYGQPPEGLDVRLSIDLNLQQNADQLLEGSTGALVLINARSGEILAMASHPNFNAAEIDEKFEIWTTDASAPLLNRATQGQYSPGTAIGPFLFARQNSNLAQIRAASEQTANWRGEVWDCALPNAAGTEIKQQIARGCPGVVKRMAESLSPEEMLAFYQSIGFTTTPNLPLLPLAQATSPAALNQIENYQLGQGEILVSPLQMALAAAALTADGLRPSPLLATAVNTPETGWIVLPGGKNEVQVDRSAANETVQDLSAPDALTWQVTAQAWTGKNNQRLSWFIGGTLPDWKGTPLALALVLEDTPAEKAQTIGQEYLNKASNP